MKKKKGFTLAEVLITITIIGIIAAVSIPILSQKYRKAEIESRLKKSYSTLSQAANNARAVGYDWGLWGETATGKPNWSNTDDEYYFFNNYLRPYVSTLKVEGYWNSYVTAYFTDGSRLWVGSGGCIDLHVDINGDKGPDEYGVDIHLFSYCPKVQEKNYEIDRLIPYAKKDVVTREQALDLCKSSDGMQCAKLIMMDGWKIKDDYPFSI